MSTYEEIAGEIINNSINSVMFIDDELLEPFSAETDGSLDLSRGIYDSFKSEDCNIDFFKFKNDDGWQPKVSNNLKGKDMLILDWQLAKTAPEYTPTLSILSEAVKKPNLHFVCIYTEIQQGAFDDIFYSINSFFAPFTTAIIQEDFDNLTGILDSAGLDFKEVFNDDVTSKLKEMVIYRSKAGEILTQVKESIINRFGKDNYQLIHNYFISKVKDHTHPTLIYCFCGLGIAILKSVLGDDEEVNGLEIRNYVDKAFLIVNHTIILITNKKDVAPKSLYEKFRNAIIHDSGNFVTLMGLEMRNLFKESSSFIGKDIDSINQLAFFHHKESSVPADAFYDFLRELWKSQAASFLYDKSKQPKIFETLDDYKEKNGIKEKMEKFIADPKEYVQHLGKLNYYYNVLVAARPENDQLRFGDIFRLIDNNGKPTDHYLICITAHCDCLYSENKINNMFYFVKGSKGNLAKSLNKGDTGFDSYIVNNKDVEVINWGDKPFTLFIKQENNDINSKIEVVIGEEKRTLEFVTTLKENYAQRIANSAFVYPFHVGIFFADTKSKDTSES